MISSFARIAKEFHLKLDLGTLSGSIRAGFPWQRELKRCARAGGDNR
jgi:hypothetical protein